MPASLLIVAVAIGQVAAPPTVPERLRQLLQDRSPQHTAYVELTVKDFSGMKAGLTERIVTETVGGSLLQRREVVSDESDAYEMVETPQMKEGRLEMEAKGLHLRTKFDEPTSAMRYQGEYLYREHGSSRATSTTPDGPVGNSPLDVRALGHGPTPGRGGDLLGLAPCFAQGIEEATYSESLEGDIHRVTATWGEKWKLTWEFDRTQGGQPVRAALDVNGHPYRWSETTLEEVEGRWVPTSTRYYSDLSGARNELLMEITAEHASFDQTWHRQEPFDPGDMGLGFGLPIVRARRPSANPQPVMPRYWSGTEFIDEEEFKELHYGYGIPLDPSVVTAKSRTRGGDEQLVLLVDERNRKEWLAEYERTHGEPHPGFVMQQVDKEDDWDRYVADFIKKNDLHGERSERAHHILKHAKGLRDSYRVRARKSTASGTAKGDERKLSYFETIEQRIFDRMLVRGLTKLVPTSARAKH